MGAESNQSVGEILRAKEEDASRAGGQFWYGFRSTHITAQRLEDFLSVAGPNPLVALTAMRGAAKAADANNPGPQFRFTSATALTGDSVAIPDGVRVRARQEKTSLALVCRSLHWHNDPAMPTHLPFTFNQLEAINGKALVPQNTTAFAQRRANSPKATGHRFELLALAELIPPYAVRLGGAEIISED